MNRRLCAISVDLDEIPHYRGLYGLAERDAGATAVYDRGLTRMAAFASEHELPLTLFAVGRDLERRESAERLAELGRAGHSVENHSYSHRYDLGRLDGEQARREVELGHERIAAVIGREPQGFRAPGYGLSDTLLDVLDALAYRFDSSVLASPPYFAVKAVAMLGIAARGRRSNAVLGPPRAQLAPRRPYRPARPWYRPGGHGLLELPIQVTPWLRLPVIGLSLLAAGPRLGRWLVRACASDVLVNLELHGIDFLEPRDGIEDVARAQRDARLALGRKLEVLGAAVAELKAAGYQLVRLAEAAELLGTG
jgi:peptidoglycan/xylan/chitin deacetylase (PgdA/CDA1 family)